MSVHQTIIMYNFERREAPSDKKPFFLFLCLESISKVDPALTDPTKTFIDSLCIVQYYMYGL